MSKARLVITAVVLEGRSQAQVARDYNVSKAWVSTLVARYKAEGDLAFEPRSRRPRTSPTKTPTATVELIVRLRRQLSTQGLDAGTDTIAWHLEHHHKIRVSTSTIHRVLRTAGLVAPAPNKRPKSSYVRFAAEQPNECWQSDFTHYRLANGTDVEIITWLDDHSRYALSVTVHARITGPIVLNTFRVAIERHGIPVSTLTDNGMVFTTRLAGGRGGRNAFEAELVRLGVLQKNSRPNHPTTCGKVERFQQTLKTWLRSQPQPFTVAEVQALLDNFVTLYNDPTPALDMSAPTTSTRDGARPSARAGRQGSKRPVSDDSPTIDPDAQQHRQQHRPEGPTMLTDRNGFSIAKSETPHIPGAVMSTRIAGRGTVGVLTATMSHTSSPAVGVPIAESRLTCAAFEAQDLLLRPGPGRSRFVLQEAELGVGRPDLVVAAAAPVALRARAERGLRLENLTEVRVLASVRAGGPSGVSPSHERSVKARLQQNGWIESSGRVVEARSVVSEALIVEAKMRDWRGGMGQVVRNRWAYSGGALLLPVEAHGRVPRRTLRHNGVGLLVLENDQLRWQVRPTWKPLSWLASTWITELLLRDLESAATDSRPA